jgi:transposase
MNPILMSVAGLDVHQKVIVCTLLVESQSGEIRKTLREYRTFRADLARMATWLKEANVDLVVMESTGIYWKAPFEALEDRDVPAMVVNAMHIKKVPGRKTDVSDSEWLAELGRYGLVKGSFIPPKDLRELRMLTRYRRKLVSVHTAETNRLHKVLEDGGIKLGTVVSNLDGVSARLMIDELIKHNKEPAELAQMAKGHLRKKQGDLKLALDGRLSDRHRFLLSTIKAHMEDIDELIAKVDDLIVEGVKPYVMEHELLQTIPGITETSAAALIAEIGNDMSRFQTSASLSSWAGLCPGNNESAGKKKSSRTTKGNNQVKTILCECAHCAVRTKSQFKAKHDSLVIRRGKRRAIIAVAHKMLEVIFVVIQRKKHYRDPGIDYEGLVVKRNASRWIKQLKNYGYQVEKVNKKAS